MIYDGHAYCFPNLNGLGGFNDFKTFNKHQQIAISQHFQPVWSDIDRKIIKDVSKIKPADKWDINSAKDQELKNKLHNSVKDKAEHLMIVDLLRNDIGKICKYGSVNVNDVMTSYAIPTLP